MSWAARKRSNANVSCCLIEANGLSSSFSLKYDQLFLVFSVADQSESSEMTTICQTSCVYSNLKDSNTVMSEENGLCVNVVRG